MCSQTRWPEARFCRWNASHRSAAAEAAPLRHGPRPPPLPDFVHEGLPPGFGHHIAGCLESQGFPQLDLVS